MAVKQHKLSIVPIGRTEPDCDLRHVCIAADLERKLNALLDEGATKIEVIWVNRPVFGDMVDKEEDHAYHIHATRWKDTD